MTFVNMPSFELARPVAPKVINRETRLLGTKPSISVPDVDYQTYRHRIRRFGADFLVLDVSTWQADRH